MASSMRIHHIGIETDSLTSSRRFYENVLGFRLELSFAWGEQQLLFLKRGDTRIELVEARQAADQALAQPYRSSAAMHLALEVEDMIKLVEQLKEKEIATIEGPHALDNGWIVLFIEGPSGELIELIQV